MVPGPGLAHPSTAPDADQVLLSNITHSRCQTRKITVHPWHNRGLFATTNTENVGGFSTLDSNLTPTCKQTGAGSQHHQLQNLSKDLAPKRWKEVYPRLLKRKYLAKRR